MLSLELKLQNLQRTVDEAVLDRGKWVDVCDRLAEVLGGVGGSIVPESIEHQTASIVVVSPSLEGLATRIFREGWVHRNYRRRWLPIIKARGHATDYDIADERTLRMDPFYADLLASQKLSTFVGLHLVTTNQAYIASVELPASSPAPDNEMMALVGKVRPILSAGARASVAIGALRFDGWKGLAADQTRAMFVLDHAGRVIDRNAASEPLIGPVLDITQQQIRLRHPRDDQSLARLLAAATAAGTQAPLPRPVFVAVPGQATLMLEAVKVPDTLRYFHSLAAALLMVRPVEDQHRDLAEMLRQHAGLTGAELKVAFAVFEGKSIEDYALAAGTSPGTVRQQLKSIYRKTGTGRQNELSALIRRLLESVSN